MSDFGLASGDLDSGPYTCTARILPTEPASQSSRLDFCTRAGDWTPVSQLIKEVVYPANVRRIFFKKCCQRNLVLKYPMNIPL